MMGSLSFMSADTFAMPPNDGRPIAGAASIPGIVTGIQDWEESSR